MRIVGSSAMSRDVLWSVSDPVLEWRKRLSLHPAPATSLLSQNRAKSGEGRASRAGRTVQARSLRGWSSPPGGVGEIRVQHVRGPRRLNTLAPISGPRRRRQVRDAAELGLPNWWLYEQASSYAAPSGDPSASRVFDHPGLRVFAASPEHLLAMKALAARPRDAEDIKQLTEVLNLHTVAEVLALVQDVSRKRSRRRG
jgi:hypothetical protein